MRDPAFSGHSCSDWTHRVWCLRPPAKTPPESTPPQRQPEDQAGTKAAEPARHILCRRCLHRLTRPAERIQVQGSHQHVFANPQGIIFEIGCYRTAEGCGYAGPSTAEFSWFQGFSWRVAVCGACLTHVGWLFLAPDKESFNGLILERLTGDV